MTNDELLEILIANSIEMHTLAAIGGSAHSNATRTRIENPRPGDLVYEITVQRPDVLGYFICKQKELVSFKEEPGGYEELYWYVEDLNGQLLRYFNCRWHRILEKSDYNDDPERTDWTRMAVIRHGLDWPFVGCRSNQHCCIGGCPNMMTQIEPNTGISVCKEHAPEFYNQIRTAVLSGRNT